MGKTEGKRGIPSGAGRSQEGSCSTDPRAGGPARVLQGQGTVPLKPEPHFCITVWVCRTKSWQPGLQETETVLSEAVHRLSHTLNSSTEDMVPEGPGPDHAWVPERLPEKQAAVGLPLGTGMLAAIMSVISIPGLTPGLMGIILEPPPHPSSTRGSAQPTSVPTTTPRGKASQAAGLGPVLHTSRPTAAGPSTTESCMPPTQEGALKPQVLLPGQGVLSGPTGPHRTLFTQGHFSEAGRHNQPT